MSEKTMCPYCGRALDEDNAMEFNGQQMCDDCYDELTTICDCCGNTGDGFMCCSYTTASTERQGTILCLDAKTNN